MNKRIFGFGGLLILVTMSIMSCGANDVTNPSQIAFPDTGVSYKTQIAPYMSLACAFSGCHDGARSDNYNVDLSSWVGLRSIRLVTPGDTNSGLVLVMYGKAYHSIPLTANENQRRGIKTWVKEGAKNN